MIDFRAFDWNEDPRLQSEPHRAPFDSRLWGPTDPFPTLAFVGCEIRWYLGVLGGAEGCVQVDPARAYRSYVCSVRVSVHGD